MKRLPWKYKGIWILGLIIIAVIFGTIIDFIINQEAGTLSTAEVEKKEEVKNTIDTSDTTDTTDTKVEPTPFLVDGSLGESMFKVMETDTVDLFPGVVHQSFRLEGVDRLEDLLQAVEILAIDTSEQSLSFEVVSPNNQVFSKKTVLQMAADANEEKRTAIAALNLDFFDMSNGMPRGLQITDGEIITGIEHLVSLLAVLPDGSIVLDQGTVMEAVLLNDSEEYLKLDGINKIRNESYKDHAFLLSDRFSPTTMTETEGIEVVIAPNDEETVLKAGATLTGKVVAIEETTNSEIPQGQFVLTATGKKADWIREHLSIGDLASIRITFKNELIHEAVHVYAGGNHSLAKALLIEGEVPIWIRNVRTSANTDRHPRTILATRGDYFYVFIFDGRQKGYADGISLIDAAEYLQLLGMEEVINADGGGSTTLIAAKPGETSPAVLNRPSGGSLRAVANALIIKKDKDAQ